MRGLFDDSYRIINDLIEVGEFLFGEFFAGKIEQPLDDRGAPFGLADDQIHVLRIRALVRHFPPQQMREGQDAGQRIVQFVGDARGQQSDRGELFAAHRLGLSEAQLLRPAFHLLFERPAPITQLLPRLAQGVGHAIEQRSKFAEFVFAAHRYRLIQIAG